MRKSLVDSTIEIDPIASFALIKVIVPPTVDIKDAVQLVLDSSKQKNLTFISLKRRKKFLDLMIPNEAQLIEGWTTFFKQNNMLINLRKPDEVPVEVKYIGILTNEELEVIGKKLGGNFFVKFVRNSTYNALENPCSDVTFYFAKLPMVLYKLDNQEIIIGDLVCPYYLKVNWNCFSCELVGHKESCCPFKELKDEEFKKIKDWITKNSPALLASKTVPKKKSKAPIYYATEGPTSLHSHQLVNHSLVDSVDYDSQEEAFKDDEKDDQYSDRVLNKDGSIPFYRQMLLNNKTWSQKMIKDDPFFFEKKANIQKPHVLWIGCSDSRVHPNDLCGLLPGDVFVHRNVAGLCIHSDLNMLSCVQYAVEVLEVTEVVIVGHYECGGVKFSMTNKYAGSINQWLSHIKDIYEKNNTELENIPEDQRFKRLVELNVMEQAKNICKMSSVQKSWKKRKSRNGDPLPRVHAWVYDLSDGILKVLNPKLELHPVFKLDI